MDHLCVRHLEEFLVKGANVGISPGSRFGANEEGFLRIKESLNKRSTNSTEQVGSRTENLADSAEQQMTERIIGSQRESNGKF